MLFGEDTKSNIIQNLSNGGILSAVRVLLCIDLLFTIPMLLAPGREIVEEALMKIRAIGIWKERARDFIRLCILAFILVASYLVIIADASNAFGLVVTLCGAIAGFSCGITVPPLLYLGTHGWRKVGLPMYIFCWSITILGAIGTVIAVLFLFYQP